MRTIYLDYCTTTPVAGSVRESMLPFLGEHYADPASNHWMGRVTHEAIEDARSAIATLLNCHPSEIFFTSGGTESANLAILGAAYEIDETNPEVAHHCIISAVEHLAVSKAAEILQKRGWRVTRVGCDAQGVIKLDHLESAIRPETKLISIMHSNHEVGTLQPVRQINDFIAGRGILLHTDACQSVGKIPCDVELLGVDMLTLSGHKMYAAKGIGALYVRSGVTIQSILHGEFQESGIRPGMENIANIAGLGQAARLAIDGLEDIGDRLATLRDRLIDRIEKAIPAIVIHGRQSDRLPGIASIAFIGRRADDLIKRTPELCMGPVGHEGRPESYLGVATTLAAMGVSPKDAASTIRLSVGWNTTEEDIDRTAELLAHAYESSPSI